MPVLFTTILKSKDIMKKDRDSNFEILRLIAMYMIVLIHTTSYSGLFCTGKNMAVCNGIINGICNIGVTCFILISGYYGIEFKVKKLVKMECMMISFSLLETVILYIIFPGQLQGAALLEQLVKSLLPFISRKYWFYSCYVCLMLFSGYIQKLIDTMDQKGMQKLLLLLLLLFSILPTVFYFEIVPDNGKGLVQMIMVYLIGRYIRKYDIRLPEWGIPVFLGLWCLNGLSHEMPIRIGDVYHHLCKDNSITNLSMAILLFLLFKGWKIQARFINRIAGYMFAVFALNNTLAGCVIKGLQSGGFQSPDGWQGFMLLVGTALIIFLECLLVGGIREFLLGLLDKKVENVYEKLMIQTQRWLEQKNRNDEENDNEDTDK